MLKSTLSIVNRQDESPDGFKKKKKCGYVNK